MIARQNFDQKSQIYPSKLLVNFRFDYLKSLPPLEKKIMENLAETSAVNRKVTVQGSHRSGKSGKFLKTFSSQGNQGKTGFFGQNQGKKISNQGNFPTVGR